MRQMWDESEKRSSDILTTSLCDTKYNDKDKKYCWGRDIERIITVKQGNNRREEVGDNNIKQTCIHKA